MSRPASQTRRAFTLIELMITVAVMGICVLVATAASSPSSRTRLIAAAQLVASDVEFARELSVSGPADPGALRVHKDKVGYWVARASDTETPVRTISGAPHSVEFGIGQHALLTGVTIEFTVGATTPPLGGMIQFDAFGRLTTAADAEITLKLGSLSAVVAVSAATGDVSIK